MNLNEEVIAIASDVADVVLGMQRDGLLNTRAKRTHTDLVTEADTTSERLLRERLATLLPAAGFWGEESNRPPSDDAFWLVDPVDGTVNFAHGLAYWAINVALVRRGESALAVTLQMPYRRIYWAEPGKGAWLREPGTRERRLQVSTTSTLRDAFLATGFPYHSSEASDNNNAEFGWFSSRCLGIRVLGAGALDIAQVAAGMLAGFWEGWLNPWDCVAGALLVREAGGVVTDYAGNDWNYRSPGFVASNGLIHDALVQGIHEARRGLTERLLTV